MTAIEPRRARPAATTAAAYVRPALARTPNDGAAPTVAVVARAGGEEFGFER